MFRLKKKSQCLEMEIVLQCIKRKLIACVRMSVAGWMCRAGQRCVIVVLRSCRRHLAALCVSSQLEWIHKAAFCLLLKMTVLKFFWFSQSGQRCSGPVSGWKKWALWRLLSNSLPSLRYATPSQRLLSVTTSQGVAAKMHPQLTESVFLCRINETLGKIKSDLLWALKIFLGKT